MVSKKRFEVEIISVCVIDIDCDVLDTVDDEWRKTFYGLSTEKAVAEHIASNLLRGARLSLLDGFADQPDSHAKLDNVQTIFGRTTAYGEVP